MRGERIPQRAVGGGLGDARTRVRNLGWPASGFPSYRVAPGPASARTDGHAPEGKQVRPTRPAIGTGVLACRRVWQVDPAIAAGRILALQHQRPPALPQQAPTQGFRQGHAPVTVVLATVLADSSQRIPNPARAIARQPDMGRDNSSKPTPLRGIDQFWHGPDKCIAATGRTPCPAHCLYPAACFSALSSGTCLCSAHAARSNGETAWPFSNWSPPPIRYPHCSWRHSHDHPLVARPSRSIIGPHAVLRAGRSFRPNPLRGSAQLRCEAS